MPHAALLILFILSIYFSNKAGAQQQLFNTYTVNEGLADNQIRCIYQDAKGFLWIGTWDGLSRYDGYKFSNYSLGNGVINDLFETKENVLYISCNDGSLFTIRNSTAIQQVKKPGFPIINRLIQFGSKIIAVTDKDGIHELSNGKLIKPNQSFPRRTYYRLGIFNDSMLVLQSDSTVEIVNSRYELCNKYQEPNKFVECKVFTDTKKRTWIGTENGVRLLAKQQENNQVIQFSELPPVFSLPALKKNYIKDISEDKKGNLWFATTAGLIKVGADQSSQVMTEQTGLPASDIYSIYQDREENIWMGTSHGLAKFNGRTDIRIYPAVRSLTSPLPIFAFPFQKSGILLGADRVRMTVDKNEVSEVADTKDYYSNMGNKNGLLLIKDKYYNTMRLVFPKDSTHTIFFSASQETYYAFKDRQESLFSGSTSGMFFRQDKTDWQSVFGIGRDIRALLIDKDNYLWAGTFENGLYRIGYDYINDTPRLISRDDYFPGKGIRSLYQDSRGNLWLGTRYHGVFVIDPQSKQEKISQHFDKASGLSSNRIKSIAEDKDGAIWICFDNGLDKLVPDKKGYRIFNFSRVHNFYTHIYQMFFDEEHSLWLLTNKGLVNITDGQMENEPPLVTFISSAVLGDSTYNSLPDREVSLSYKYKQVQFEFAAPEFINQQQVLYSYRLSGSSNTDWSRPSNEHSVSYAGLRPGNYQFEVRAMGWNGEWGKTTSFTFYIQPPFWQTWWFRLAALLALATVIIWLVRRRIKAIRHESEMKQKISETEMMALRAQMNPHFIFNCLNAIDNLVQTNQKEKATTYLARFAKLIRNVLESSKNNVVAFQRDFESMQLYLQMEQFRCNSKFSYELSADDELMHSDYKIPPLIIQPFVENAIHHGLLSKENGDRKLIVHAALENDVIRYTITDNGVGRSRAKELKELNKPGQLSYGIAITEERVHLYNQHKKSNDFVITDLWENGQAAGTRVEVCLKVYDR